MYVCLCVKLVYVITFFFWLCVDGENTRTDVEQNNKKLSFREEMCATVCMVASSISNNVVLMVGLVIERKCL